MTNQADDKTLLILWHSVTGATEQLAAAIAAGAAREAAVRTRCLPMREATAQHLLDAQAYVFATPEMLGSMAGLMKDGFERCYYPLLGRIAGRRYATAVCAGSDGQGAAAQVARIVTGWRLVAVAEPLIVCTHAQTPEAIGAPKTLARADLARGTQLGAALAAGLALGVY